MTSRSTQQIGQLVTDMRSGFASGDSVEDGVLQLRMNNIARDGSITWSKQRRIRATAKQLRDFALQPGDVLFNATNSPEMVGKSALVRKLDEPTLFSNHFVRLRTDPGRLDESYLARFLGFEFERGVFRHAAKRWVNQATVSRETLAALRVPLPPLPDQRRIAAILDQADEMRAKRRFALTLLDELANSLFAEIFDARKLQDSPARPLQELVDPERPLTYGILMPGPDTPGGVPYVRVTDINSSGIAEEAVRRTTTKIAAAYSRSILRSGDLLMSIRGHVGRTAIVPPGLDGANITQDTARIALAGVDTVFVRAWLATPRVQSWMKQRTKGVAVRGINLADVKQMPVPVPPLADQQRFREAIDALERSRFSFREHLDKLDELFVALQHRAFAGEL